MRLDRSQALYERARAVMPDGTTRIIVSERPFPVYLESGSGAYVVDVDGNRYLDFTNNSTTLIHGHCYPAVVDAVTTQLRRGACFANPTESEIELAELLCRRVKWFEQIRFMGTGSEAVMMAVRVARAATGRIKIAKCEGSFHGNFDPVEVSFDPGPESWGGERPVPVPYGRGTPPSVLDQVVVLPFNNVAVTEQILIDEAEEVACVLIDPMPARAGLVPATSEYLAFLRAFTQRHGIVLTSDEVLNFRMSPEGAITRLGFEADLCSFGKIIGGGLAIGAVAGRSAFMAMFDASRGKPPVPHSGTFTANPLSMVAGNAAMRAMTPEAFDRLNALGEMAREGLRDAIRRSGVPAQITGLGSLFQVKMNDRKLRGYRDQYPDGGERARLGRLVRAARDEGVLISSTGLGALSTPMTSADIELLVDVIGRCLERTAAWASP